MVGAETSLRYRMAVVSSLFSGGCDFMAQSILVRITYVYYSFSLSKSQKIYRCWIVWNHNIRVVIFPSILAIAYLGQSTYFILTGWFWLLLVALWIPGSVLLDPTPGWVYAATLTSFTMSLAVNALVTGLIVFRILKVYLEVVKPTSGGTGESKLRPVIFILIESGMALLCMQLAQFVLYFIQTDGALVVDQPIAYTLQMLNVTIKSVIITLFFF